MKLYIPLIKPISLVLFTSLMILPMDVFAQRMPHRGGGGGAHRAAPSGGGGAHRMAPARGGATHRATPARKSINGGSRISTSRPKNLQKNHAISHNRPSTNHNSNHNRPNRPSKPVDNHRPSNNRPGNHNNNNHHNNGHHNNGHHNNGHGHVRPPHRPYPRPPHRYGGWGYYAFNPYFYHPFRPFYWGPIWHPWGFFVTSLATTAIVISINNERYHYDQGVYYTESKDGYTVVEAPIGATIKVLPNGYETVHETTNNYYYGGTFYEKSSDGYAVVAPQAGSVIEHLPEGAEEVRMGDQTFVKYGDTYFQPVKYNGSNMYEVTEAKEE